MGMCVGAHIHTHKHTDTGNTHVYVSKVYDYFDAMCVSSGDSLKKGVSLALRMRVSLPIRTKNTTRG